MATNNYCRRQSFSECMLDATCTSGMYKEIEVVSTPCRPNRVDNVATAERGNLRSRREDVGKNKNNSW